MPKLRRVDGPKPPLALSAAGVLYSWLWHQVFDDGHGADDPLSLIVEVTAEKAKDRKATVSTAKAHWAPAVNNAATGGRGFIEIRDP